MITSLRVDGFKSLKNFEISFNKGINVLIGPNGVGKTNICQSLILLSSLRNNTILDTFTKYGGVGSTFNTVNTDNENRLIKIGVSGNTNGSFQNKKYEIHYEYSIVLKLDDELIINEESLHIFRKAPKTMRFNKVLSIIQSNNKLISKIHNVKLIGNHVFEKEGRKTLHIERDDSDQSFLQLMSQLFFVCYLITEDFDKLKSFNIDPNIAKLSCDVSEPHEMRGNGRYLANTLHFMKKESEDLSEINSIMEQLLPNYKKITPVISKTSYKRYFSLVDSNNNEFSSNSLSDGTIKLLATLVGIIKQKEKTSIIEEPENYLHPYACKLLISYLRDTYNHGICILTSHSESILNQIRPEELIICELSGSFTNSHRLTNISKIKNNIEKSGFGCGYHYVSGNLGGVPNF